MRLVIAAIGRLKSGAESELCARYVERLNAVSKSTALGPVKISEMPEARASSADARKADEAARLLAATAADDALRVVLDERGKPMTSTAFAALLRAKRDGGARSMAFLLGGADGHGQAVLDAAHLTLSLGPMTLPHGLARVILVEQLYRAATIISGHPYHRA